MSPDLMVAVKVCYIYYWVAGVCQWLIWSFSNWGLITCRHSFRYFGTNNFCAIQSDTGCHVILLDIFSIKTIDCWALNVIYAILFCVSILALLESRESFSKSVCILLSYQYYCLHLFKSSAYISLDLCLIVIEYGDMVQCLLSVIS